jgi:probable rRNA maturation factor
VRIDLSADPAPPAPARRALRRFCLAAATATGLGPGWRVGLALVDDAAMQSLNRQWRDHDKPTNVLSFPGTGEPLTPRSRLRDLGDLALSPAYCAREADAAGMDREMRLGHLVVHGILHLAGWDHERGPEDEAAMEALEERILASMATADFRALRPLVG